MPAVKLMQQHPNHLIVYSFVRVRWLAFANGRIRPRRVHIVQLVRPAEHLQTNRVYFLVHIPKQYRKQLDRHLNLSQSRTVSGASRRPSDRSPFASPTCSPTSSPGSFWSSTASPLGSPLPPPLPKSCRRATVLTPLRTHTPTLVNGSAREPARAATPLPAHIQTRFNGRGRGPTRAATPRASHVPRRLNHGSAREMTTVATPLPAHIPTHTPNRLNGSNRETARVVNKIMQAKGDAAHSSNRIQHIRTDRHTLRSIINQKSLASSGRVGPLPKNIEISNVTPHQSLQQRNSTTTLARSPENCAITRPSIATAKVDSSERPKGSSPYSHRQYAMKNSTPRRPSKGASEKFSRGQRRYGMRFYLQSKASVRKSPARASINGHNGSEDAMNIPFLKSLDSGELNMGTESRGATPAPAPGARSGTASSGGISHTTHLKMNRSLRSRFWAPRLEIISENSGDSPDWEHSALEHASDTSAVVDLIARQYYLLNAQPRQSSYLRPTI